MRCARAGGGAARLAGGLGVPLRPAAARRLRDAARAARRGAGAARRPAAALCPARAGGGGAGGRAAERRACLRAHAPALAAGLPPLAAAVRRRGEARGRRRAGGVVRIMTVHGAKGLQAPLVILPDTTALPPEDGPLLWATDPATGVAVPLWSPRKEVAAPPPTGCARRRGAPDGGAQPAALRRDDPRRGPAGGMRLGSRARRRAPSAGTAWSARLRPARRRARAVRRMGRPCCAYGIAAARRARARGPPEPARRRRLPSWAGASPDWRAVPPPPEPARPEPLAPSRPDGAGLGPVPHAVSPLAAGSQGKRGSSAASLSMPCCSICPRAAGASVRRLLAPGSIGPDTGWRDERGGRDRGRGAGDPRAS